MEQGHQEAASTTRRLILNPESGRGDHAERVRHLALEHGFPVVETEQQGHAIDLARHAADDGVELLAVCGGDGTIHETVQGLYAANALDSVTLCVIPVGTENIIAADLGIQSTEEGFEIANNGETRRLDLGLANNEPFVMSAIAGLPADVSAAATQDLKQQFGSLAFIIGGVREGLKFDGLHVEVTAETEDGEHLWRGDALAVLVGNLRQVSKTGGQANAEDGKLELTIVEQMPSGDLLAEAIEQRLLHHDTPQVQEFQATQLTIHSPEKEAVTFSLDGEIRELEAGRLQIVPQSLAVRVGRGYDPDPEPSS